MSRKWRVGHLKSKFSTSREGAPMEMDAPSKKERKVSISGRKRGKDRQPRLKSGYYRKKKEQAVHVCHICGQVHGFRGACAACRWALKKIEDPTLKERGKRGKDKKPRKRRGKKSVSGIPEDGDVTTWGIPISL